MSDITVNFNSTDGLAYLFIDLTVAALLSPNDRPRSTTR
jgi:hypothetical protein